MVGGKSVGKQAKGEGMGVPRMLGGATVHCGAPGRWQALRTMAGGWPEKADSQQRPNEDWS